MCRFEGVICWVRIHPLYIRTQHQSLPLIESTWVGEGHLTFPEYPFDDRRRALERPK